MLGVPPVQFTVFGSPAPQGSKKPITKADGDVVLVESSSARVTRWRRDVRDAFTAAAGPGWVPLAGPICLDVVLTLHRPLDRPKTLRVYPAVQPDLDKLLRATYDGLTQAGMWLDDKQAVRHRRLDAFYAGDEDPDALDSPGAVIRAWVLPIVPITPR